MINNKLSEILGRKRIKMSELQRMNKTKSISFDTINKLCNALECNTQELFEFIPD